jgi:hypothetical protein
MYLLLTSLNISSCVLIKYPCASKRSRQSERFDAQGYFIKTQLEIFNDVSSKYIHDPTKYWIMNVFTAHIIKYF